MAVLNTRIEFHGKGKDRLGNSIRGAESNDLTGRKVNNEVAFCMVYNVKQKQEIERLFLKNRISYYIQWQEKGFWQRLMGTDAKEKNVFIMCIHDTAVAQAKELVVDMSEIKILVP